MHKTYLNEVELQIIKGADKIVEKIGGFPSMENCCFESLSVNRSKDNHYRNDIELVYDITGWLETLDFYNPDGNKEKVNYYHKYFDERRIKITFHNCFGLKLTGFPPVNDEGGEIKFGGKKQEDQKNRYQDRLPGLDIIIARPYTCFYMRSGHGMVIYFDEKECEISAELF